MKILLTALCLVAIKAHSQIEVRESPTVVKIGSIPGAQLSYIADKDTVYSLMFDNAKYKTVSDIKTISFTGSIDKLYDILKAVLETGKEVDMTLGGKSVSLSKTASSIMFIADGGYFYLSSKQLNKLFGRDKSGTK